MAYVQMVTSGPSLAALTPVKNMSNKATWCKRFTDNVCKSSNSDTP